MLYKILPRRHHSLELEMTPSQHLLNCLQLSNSNYDKLHLPPPTLPSPPPKVTQRPCLSEASHPILASPLPLGRETRSKPTIHTQDIANAPLPPRVVTPRTLSTSPPKVPSHSHRLSPRNLSQHDFCGMDTAHMTITLRDNHWSRQHQKNPVIHPYNGKEIDLALMKDPHLQPLW
jgi:hypothetical protein